MCYCRLLIVACALLFSCGAAKADLGNPLSGLNGLTPPTLDQPQIPKAPNLLDPTMKPVLSVNPRDLKPRRAARPHAAQPVSVPAEGGARQPPGRQ